MKRWLEVVQLCVESMGDEYSNDRGREERWVGEWRCKVR